MNTASRVVVWTTVFGLSGVGATSGVLAEEGHAPHEVRKIMGDLNDHMWEITEGISHEDWIRVAEHAEAIADYPRPSKTERSQIMAFVGADVARFEELDNAVRDVASRMADEAGSGDRSVINESFERLRNDCRNCHKAFQNSYREHLHLIATGG